MEPVPAVDDASLLTRIAHGDQAALSAIYDRYARIIHSVAFKSLGSVEESEEVVLDVFAQVWRIADRYETSKGRADTWLFMLARSRILDRLRKVQRNNLLALAFNDVAEIQIPSSDVLPMEEAMISERRARVVCALKNLPNEQRLVIELAYYKGWTQSQIAAHTGLSLGTVKTRVRLGLNKLKLALGNEIS
jgi:RNA polymerase sigma-70 factor, ECF subfamily